MADVFSRTKRSWVMSRIRAGDTQPELKVRRMLHARGYRFRLHRADLPGKPDIILPKHRTAVFVHGCFWHGHGCQKGRRPASNSAYWTAKLEGNIRRDARRAREYRSMGWRRIVVWECQLRDIARVERRLAKLLEESR